MNWENIEITLDRHKNLNSSILFQPQHLNTHHTGVTSSEFASGKFPIGLEGSSCLNVSDTVNFLPMS